MPNQKVLAEKKAAVYGKYIIGIDPAKVNHRAAIFDPKGIQIGKSFSFKNSRPGFLNMLKKARLRIPEINNDNTVIAIETSCNLWHVVLRWFHEQGFQMVLVSPLSTKHSRPLIAHDFSHTDPKDAYLVADNAQKGHFDFYQKFDDKIEMAFLIKIKMAFLRIKAILIFIRSLTTRSRPCTN